MNKIQEKIDIIVNKKFKEAKKLFSKEKHLKFFYKNIALNPLTINNKQYKDIKQATEGIGKLLEKTVKFYFKEKKIQAFFEFNSKQKNIIRDYVPEMKALYLSRFDGAFTKNGNFKFIEFNVNHPGGIERLDKLANIIYDFYKPEIEFKNLNSISENYLKMVEKIWTKSSKNGNMIMFYGSRFDERDKKALEIISKNISKTIGIKIYITHINKLQYKLNNLYLKNKKISFAYRAELLQRFWQYDYKVVKPLLQALKEKKIIMYNLPKAYICGTKDLFALWYEKWFRKMLTKKEIYLIDKYIPKTMILNNNLLIKKDILKYKNNWVIKPVAGLRGSRVYIGKKLTDCKWHKVVNTHFGSKHYIIQKAINIAKYPIININTKTKDITRFEGYVNVSPWLIDGNLSGITARFSTDLIINIAKGGGIMTIFVDCE